MRILISPAKKMTDTSSIPWEGTPLLLARAKAVMSALKRVPREEIRTLYRCSEKLAEETYRLLFHFDFEKRRTPALLAYQGIQFQYMSPSVFSEKQWENAQKSVRILSGLYGIVKPLDGISPYRLEMENKLSVQGEANLYRYWGSSLHDALYDGEGVVLNLASEEYARCIRPFVEKGERFVDVLFLEEANGKRAEKGVYAKMARGRMTRFLSDFSAPKPEDCLAFSDLGYRFDSNASNEDRIVFVR